MQFNILTALGLLLTIVYFYELHGVRGVAPDNTNGTERRPVYIGIFLPIKAHPYYPSLFNTLQVAVDHVNNLTGILDDYELKMRWNWTQVCNTLIQLDKVTIRKLINFYLLCYWLWKVKLSVTNTNFV